MARGVTDGFGATLGGGTTGRATALGKYLKNIEFSGKNVPKKANLDPVSLTPKSALKKDLERMGLVKPKAKPAAKAPAGINPKSMTREPAIKGYLKKAGL